MPNFMRFHWIRLTTVCWIILLFGCAATFNPRPLDEVEFMERAHTKQEGGVKVTAAVLTSQECVAKFGANLYRRNIQPVWLEIENKNNEPMWFLPLGLDPAYFTPLESAFLSRFAIRETDHEKLDRYFFEHGMGNYIEPGKKVSGFVYTNLDEGTKAFNVDIIGEDQVLRNFTFFIQDLWYSQGLKSFGYVKGVGAAPYSEPRGNLTGDPYFTDGYRAVLWVSSQPAAFSEVGWIDWETPLER